MKRLYPVFTLILISLIAFHCQKEARNFGNNNNGNQPPENSGTNTSAPLTATLQGNVTDEKGQPAIGVTIKVGTKTATTNAKGYFRISDAPLDKNASVVTADKSGYFKAYRSFSATNGVNQVYIKLIKKANAGTITASAGGNVTLTDGAIISLPANGIVKSSGSAYSGSVTVFASYIDPTSADIAQTIPGSLMGIDKRDKSVNLSSYGMLAVELESSAGEKLQLASGSSATITIPIPASMESSAPSFIPLWHVDEQTGIWKEEGSATKNGTNYVGTVNHFSYWNADVSVPTIGFSAIFKTSEGVPVTYAHIRIKAATGFIGNAYGVTDSAGQVSGLIPANMNLVLEVLNSCNEIAYSQNIGPYSSSINLGTITIPNTNSVSFLTIKGKILNCSNAPVSDGHALVTYGNVLRNVSTNSAGEFALTLTVCAGAPTSCQIIPTDATAQQQGVATNVTITKPITNAGNLVACGTSTLQYINYNVDGVSYNLSSASVDSLFAYTSNGVTRPIMLNVMGSRIPSANFGLSFDCAATPGSYPLTKTPVNHKLSVNDYRRIGVIEPFNVIITSFPQAIGGYYEGSFTGQFRDSANLTPLHDISCSFRIAKNW